MIKKGFAEVDKVLRGKKKLANCKSCFSYGPDKNGDEGCNNTNVTSFDFVREVVGIEYCTYWDVVRPKEQKSLVEAVDLAQET